MNINEIIKQNKIRYVIMALNILLSTSSIEFFHTNLEDIFSITRIILNSPAALPFALNFFNYLGVNKILYIILLYKLI